MNNKRFRYTVFFIFILISSVGYAQDKRTLDTKVADILAQMPTKDLVHRDRLVEESLQLGPEGFRTITDQLSPAGTGDDTPVRFAINSLARYVSDFGMEKERGIIEKEILRAIQQQSDLEIVSFLLSQLNLVAGHQSVEAMRDFLSDDKLSDPATQVLLSIGSEEAAKLMLANLHEVNDKNKITLVQALGKLAYQPSMEKIGQLAGSENVELRKVSLKALAEIAAPESYQILLKAAKNADFSYEPTHAVGSFLFYAERLAETHETALAEKSLKTVFKACREPGKLHYYSKALSVYSRYFELKALPLLLSAMDNSEKDFRYSALNLAKDIGGIETTRQWIAKAGQVKDEVKAEIIDMLGRRGDRFAVDFVRSGLASASKPVREESIEALVQLEGSEAIPVLIDHLKAGNDTESTKAALNQLLDKEHLSPIAEELKVTRGGVKVALIEIIGEKSGNQYFDQMYTLCRSEDPRVKEAAFTVLPQVSVYKNLPELISKLQDVDEESEIKSLQLAIVAASKGNEAERTEKGLLLQALSGTAKKERFIVILPEIGGDPALNTLVNYFEDSTGELKETAFDALSQWKNYSAASSLYRICETSSGFYRERAFSGFVRLVNNSSLPDEQKLLQYRKIMPYARTTVEKISLIESIGRLKTFLSLIYLQDFLKDNDLQQATSRSIMQIALPDENGKNGFTGDIVGELLAQTASVITGEESEYDIIRINNYLADMPDEKGFVSMFNGENLQGWKGLVGNPVTREQMTDAELLLKQKQANTEMRKFWAVQDNTIVFNGNGANLVSEKEYGDFELIVDWRITKEGDSGIYLRGTPQVQIWDTSRVEVGAQVGSGGLYNNQKYQSKPLKVADNPVGEWNSFHIKMIGENVSVYLNGELVVDKVPLENYWDRSRPIFPTGPIELQAHGTNLAFRDIYVREINTEEIGLSREEVTEGFVSLFNGFNLDGWQGNKTDYYAENGELIVNPTRGGRGNLFSQNEYSDFIFRFEFQLTPGANNGLAVRAPLEGDAAYRGMELQILDNTAPIYANLKKYQYHGSVYGVIPAKRGYLNPVGEWNYQEVYMKGNEVRVILNGTVILEGNIAEAGRGGTIDGRDHPGLKREKGYIGFLGHGSPLKFRNIRIKTLK